MYQLHFPATKRTANKGKNHDTISVCSTDPINNLPTKIDEEEAESAKEIESDKAVLSQFLLCHQLQLSSRFFPLAKFGVKYNCLLLPTATHPAKSLNCLDFNLWVMATWAMKFTYYIYFSSPNVIKPSVEVEKKCPNKAMKITSCATSEDEAIANVVNSQPASSATVHYTIDNSS